MKNNKLSLLKRNNYWISLLLLGLFFISFFLRFYKIPENLFFGPEQGIDFLAIRNIAVNHKITLIGAKTDISGVFHGPIYYYLSVIPFLISSGNPVWISAFFIFINSLTVFLLFYLGKIMFSRRVGIISSVFFTFSFGVIVYPRWLSSHPLSIPLSVLLFISLFKFIQGKLKWLYIATIVFGFLGQSEFLNLIFYLVILLVFIFLNRKVFFETDKISLFVSSLLLIIFSIGNYILFDVRHQFLISKSLLALLIGNKGYYFSFTNSFFQASQVFLNTFSKFIFPLNIWLSSSILLIGVCLIVYKKYSNSLILLLWLFIPFLVLVFLRHNILEQFFVSVSPAALLFSAVITDFFWKRKKIFGIAIIFLLVTGNLYYWFINVPINRNIFFQSTQPDLKFSDQMKVINTIYTQANNKPFSFQAYTIPYWSQEAWEYLFLQYGKNKYGYMPVKEKAKKLFVIIQDDPSNKKLQNFWIKNEVNNWGTKNAEFRYGILQVQELKIE